MEITLDKRFPLAVGVDAAWAVLADLRSVAACMPGAQITEQLDETHFKGIVRSKIGPAAMVFGGDIELLGISATDHSIEILGRGADRAGSSASMRLAAHLEASEGQACVLVGNAKISVAGKLSQFGSRLLIPVSDMMLAKFAENFCAAASAAPAGAAQLIAGESQIAPTSPAVTAIPQAARELNVFGLAFGLVKRWFSNLFGRVRT